MKEEENSTDPNVSTEPAVEEYVVRRRKKKRGVRQANLDALPQVDKVYELKGKKRFCDACGEELKIIGKHLAHRKIKCKPMEFYCENFYVQVVKSERSKCYFWAASSAKEFSQHNIAYFFYAASRGGEVIPQIIGPDYRGCLMCDGHSAYQQERLPNGTLKACLIHIARKFKEIVKIGKGAKILQHSKAAEAATKLGEIFHIEHDLSYTTGEEKAAQRRLRLKPLMDEFYRFIGEIEHPISKLRVAINYALNQKERVYQIFEHGELPLDNNHDEQLIRPTTTGLKNYLFAKTEAGAEANAIWYTFIQTAKLNQLKVREYLEHLLSAFTWTESPVWEAYLPWDPEIQRKFGTQ
ncbi:IS66 family transposase [Limosilactobacillus ingluviei]|uniref:IS66 family transposase n=1 Tax=Limosilactobacillus ingluviei TaxID=148604 RepID=UPI0002D2C329|nr:transposase [Limosilactobacillus ingluviei]